MEEVEGEWVLVGEGEDSLKIRFDGPAKHWTDAAPIGNGRLGAMIWGGVDSDQIQLNDDTLWTGVPGDYTSTSYPSALTQVRNLVDEGKYSEATSAAMSLKGKLPEVYQPLGGINLEFTNHDDASVEGTYERELDLDTATVTIKYLVNGINVTREHFSSGAHQVVVTKVSSSVPGALSFLASLDSKLNHIAYVEGENQIIMKGSCPGQRTLHGTSLKDNPQGLLFTAVLEIRVSSEAGAVTKLNDQKLKVEGSTWAVLLLSASSSFDGPLIQPSASKKDPTAEALETLNSIQNLSYSDLYAYHLNDYQKLFRRVSIQLSRGSIPEEHSGSSHANYNSFSDWQTDNSGNLAVISTAERVESFKNDEDPSLVALLFQYGRYLLISSSRPGSQVANLQGIWNQDTEPKWDAAPHLNINLEMNYWPSLPCNLRECQEPLFDYISSLAKNGSKTAKVNYGANGWVVHHVSDVWAKTSPDRGKPVWFLWSMGGAWLCCHLWEHYRFTLDKDFLEGTAYPLLEGCVTFLLEWLIEGHSGYLETNPSTSPEHNFIAADGKLACVSNSSTMDMAIIREVFSAIVSAAEILGRSNNSVVENVRSALVKLRPTTISSDGSIMEWAQDFQDPDVHHRHLSHLFGLYPGHSISKYVTPELCAAAAKSLYKRGEDGPGWSTAWKIACWARLHDSANAYRMVKHLFNLVDPDHEVSFHGGLYSNLFGAHPPFQIDANFGFTAGVAEMFIQSTEEDMYLLPALPRDKWPSGCVKGLKARGAVTVDICWRQGELHETNFYKTTDQNSVTRVHYKGNVACVRLSPGTVYTLNEQLECSRTRSLLDLPFHKLDNNEVDTIMLNQGSNF